MKKYAVIAIVAGVAVALGASITAAGLSASRPAVRMMRGSGYTYSSVSCSAPASLPGQRVDVVLADMGMNRMMGGSAPLGVRMMLRAAPATIRPGQVSLVAGNMGWRTHELVVLPLADGTRPGRRVPGPDGKVDETGSLGEASTSCGSGAGEGIGSGTVSWTTLTLRPGRYELLCNLSNHYANGMYQELDVAS